MRNAYRCITALLVLWPLSLHASDPVLDELREMRGEQREMRSDVKDYHEDVIRQGERVIVISEKVSEHELELEGRPGNGNSPGLISEVQAVKNSQQRHTWLWRGLAGLGATVVGGVGIEAGRRRLWPKKNNSKKER